MRCEHVDLQMGDAAKEVLEEDNRKMQNINDTLDTIQSDLAIANRVGYEYEHDTSLDRTVVAQSVEP